MESFAALKRCLDALAAQAYATSELGSTQARFLRHLAQHPRLSQAELSRATGSDPALTGRALQTLIERGWVRRQRSSRDRRSYLLQLSAAGQRTFTRLEGVRARLVDRVAAPLDEADLEDFERIAGKLLAAFSPPPPGQDARR